MFSTKRCNPGGLAAFVLMLCASPGLADATFTTDISFGSTPATAEIAFVEGGNALSVTLSLVDVVGDLRGFFFNVADPLLLQDLSVAGAWVSESVFSLDSVTDLGQGANINPGGPFDAGIRFGTPGQGQDQLTSVTFTLSSSGIASGITDLDVADLLALTPSQGLPLVFGVRVTSIQDCEEGSAKIGVSSPVPEPGSVLIWTTCATVVVLRLRRNGRN